MSAFAPIGRQHCPKAGRGHTCTGNVSICKQILCHAQILILKRLIRYRDLTDMVERTASIRVRSLARRLLDIGLVRTSLGRTGRLNSPLEGEDIVKPLANISVYTLTEGKS
jgi:hypothetical protein